MKKQKWNNGWIFWKDGKEEKSLVSLPHDAMIFEKRSPDAPAGAATGFYPGGKYYYEKTFLGSQEYADSAVILEFEGIYQKSTVWLNDEKVGGWVYGYTGFYIDLTGKLKIGENNVIRVETDNSEQPNSRWYSGSGIYRDVNIYIGAKKYIVPDGIRVRTVSIAPAVLDISVEHIGGTVRCQVMDGDALIAQGEGEHIQLEIPDAKLWSDESPELYTVCAQIMENGEVIDSDSCKIGIRTLSWDAEHGFAVNGKTVKLRGGCVHHDHGPLGARWYEKAERRRLTKLKDMGYNAVRYSHYPANRGFLELCDEIGFYVLDETFDQWKVPQSAYDYANYFDAEWEKDIAALIRKDYSHPSVIMYCVGNEITDVGLPHGPAICRAICDKIKELDDTRPTTIAINTMLAAMTAKAAEDKAKGIEQKPMGSLEANEIVTLLGQIMASITAESIEPVIGGCLNAVDIAGLNYGDNLYPGMHTLSPDRVILSSEAFPSALGRNWPMIEKTPYVIGDFMWTAWDYLGEAGVGMPVYGTRQAPFSKSYPCQSADIGAFDLIGYPEPMAYYAAIVWGRYDKPYLAVRPVNHSGDDYALGNWRMTDARHSWSWEGCEGKTAEVEVYSNSPSVKLLLNGSIVGEGFPEQCKCVFSIPYESGILEAVAYDSNGKETGRDSLRTAGAETRLTVTPEDAVIQADEGALAYFAIEVTDSQGTVKMLKDCKISVSVEGPAVLEAVGSARAQTEERFDGGSYTTYYGRMIAILRSNGLPGKITIKAKAEDLSSETAEIEAV